MFKRKKQTGSPDIPTASLGDITFLMLIFFLVTSSFSTEMGLQIVLPEESKETITMLSKNIVHVRINKFGDVRVEDEPVDWMKLSDKAVEMLEKPNGDSLVFSIIPTRMAKYDYMIRVFDQLKIAYEKTQMKEKISLSPAEDDE
ncbi:MAG: biopolymer transporter ExbD [bacterium]|nr:biopolymer transporter ExbD [bacterium]